MICVEIIKIFLNFFDNWLIFVHHSLKTADITPGYVRGFYKIKIALVNIEFWLF